MCAESRQYEICFSDQMVTWQMSIHFIHAVITLWLFLAPCPTGTYYEDDPPTCTPCERGFYSSETAQNECQPCPDNKSTYSEGATHEDLCYGIIFLSYYESCMYFA